MAKPELAGGGFGLGLWRLHIRDYAGAASGPARIPQEALGLPEALQGRLRPPGATAGMGGAGPRTR
eukprot:15135105-Alexandrium_andersonii.AAC.1